MIKIKFKNIGINNFYLGKINIIIFFILYGDYSQHVPCSQTFRIIINVKIKKLIYTQIFYNDV